METEIFRVAVRTYAQFHLVHSLILGPPRPIPYISLPINHNHPSIRK